MRDLNIVLKTQLIRSRVFSTLIALCMPGLWKRLCTRKLEGPKLLMCRKVLTFPWTNGINRRESAAKHEKWGKKWPGLTRKLPLMRTIKGEKYDIPQIIVLGEIQQAEWDTHGWKTIRWGSIFLKTIYWVAVSKY